MVSSEHVGAGLGAALVCESRPKSRLAHWQRFEDGGQLFVVNGSQIFDLNEEGIDRLDAALEGGDPEVERVLADMGVCSPPFISDETLESPPLHALSLAVAQTCNLGCSYCYAGGGGFGETAKVMSLETALAAVQLLISSAVPGSRLNLAFLGGEPLANRSVLRAATHRAAELASVLGVRITFSVTTNGSLLTTDDAEFFERFGFAVTISLDGLREDHDRQRPFKNGKGTFDRIIRRAHCLLEHQDKMQVSVRATVTPNNLRLRECLEFFLNMKFHSVGFSPVLHSPSGQQEFSGANFSDLLQAMVECGLEFEKQTLQGKRFGFANVLNALQEIHRGTHRPYPCGAGAGYLGVSAGGNLAACHRFVGDDRFKMGAVSEGIDRYAQNKWLRDRHVHAQVPCGSCWARYLCAGGCHHEVLARGHTACDYIRGWLQYCLQAYGRISRLRPDFFVRL